MKLRRWISVLAVIIGLFATTQSNGASVNKIFGAAANGPAPSIPLTPTILCQAPSFCTRISAPDWSDANSERFFGSDGQCRESTDGAMVWSDCTADPSATVYFHYAVTRTGAIIAGANDSGGSVFRLARSDDGADTWSTVYSGTPVDLLNTVIVNGRLRCARNIDLCVFFGRGPTNNLWGLVSTNDGVSWTLTDPIPGGINVSSHFSVVMSDDGFYYAGPSGPDGFSNIRSITFDTANWSQNAVVWPTSNGGACNWSFLLAGNRRTICHATTLGTTYTMRDETGTILTTFNIPDVPSDGGVPQVGLAYSVTDTSIHLVRGDTAGQTGLWVSVDSGVSFVKLFATDPAGQGISNQGSVYQGVDGCIYFSYITSALASTVFKVCL